MTIWIIMSWVFVALLTAGNVLFFLKLKAASEQMMKAAFPGAQNMSQAMSQMQKMMGQMGLGANDPRLKQAMDMMTRSKR